MKVGDLVHVRLDCWLRNLGKWAAGAFEVVTVDGEDVTVKRPGPGVPSFYDITMADVTISKGSGRGRKARR